MNRLKTISINKACYRLTALFLSLMLLLNSFNIISVAALENDNNDFQLSIKWNSEGQTADTYNYDSIENESRYVRLKIYYENKKINESGYKANEIVITIPGLKDADRDGNNNQAAIAADETLSEDKIYDWSYTYNSTNNTYTFTNNKPIPANSTFQGSFEIVWQIDSRSSKEGYNQDFQAKLYSAGNEPIESNIISYRQTRKKDIFGISEELESMYTYQIPAEWIENGKNYDDYTWVNHTVRIEQIQCARNTQSEYYKVWLREGAITQDLIKTGETKVIDGKVYEGYRAETLSKFKVAYPKDLPYEEYVKNYIEFIGTYYEETDEELLADTDIQFKLVDYPLIQWMYGVYPYDPQKEMYGDYNDFIRSHDGHCAYYGAINSSKLEDSKGTYTAILKFTYEFGGDTEDENQAIESEFIDNYMRIQNRTLRDDEYNFKSVIIPSYENIENKNKLMTDLIKENRFKVSLYIRHSGNEDFETTPYETIMLKSKSQTISVPDDTVGIKVIFHNIKEYFENMEIITSFTLHTNDENIKNSNGTLVNRMINNVFRYQNGEKIQIGYFEREASLHILEIANSYYVRNEIKKSNEDKDYYYFNGSMTSWFQLEQGNDLSKFSLYTITPEGTILNPLYNTSEKLFERLSFTGQNLKPEFIREHAELEVIENYQNSGRTYIAVHFDFSDSPVVTNGISVGNIPICLDKDSITTNILTLTMRAVALIDEGGKWYSGNIDNNPIENNIWVDIDQDGNKDEVASFSLNSINPIFIPEYSQFELTKSVKTEISGLYVQPSKDENDNYNDSTVPMTYKNKEYSYKIRVRVGEGKAKNIIFSDILESAPLSEWQGEFVRVDYSKAQKLYGITPTVYYSTQKVRGKPNFEDSDVWTTSKLENKKIKTVAVDFGSFELNEGKYIYIEVVMKSPKNIDDCEDKITENVSTVYYDEYTDGGTFIEQKELPSNEIAVKLVSYMGTIKVIKTDEVDGERLSGAKFALYKKISSNSEFSLDNGEFVTNLTTDNEGIAKARVKYGTYYLVETQAPQGYIQSLNYPMIELNADEPDITVTKTIDNERQKGQITIIKVSDRDSSQLLPGASFKIYKSNGEFYKSCYTDDNGNCSVSDLEWDDYYIVETDSPKGYIKSDEKYEFTIDKKHIDTISITILNTQKPASVKLIKCEQLEDGTHTDNTLSGAVYELHKDNDDLVGTYITDENGEISVDDLTFGSYYFKETVPTQGYEKYDNNISFTLNYEHTSQPYQITTYDQRKKGNIWLQKVDDNDQYVKGAEYALFKKADNTQVDETGKKSQKVFKTNDEGVLEINDVYWGQYYLKEVTSPKGYELNETHYDIDINSKTVDTTLIVNTSDPRAKGLVELTKVDENDESLTLEGAVFTLYKDNGSIYKDDIITGADGKVLVNDIDWGSYYFLEKTAPEGYGLNPNKIRFSVNYITAEKVQYLTVTDPQTECELKVTKSIKIDETIFAHGNPTFTFKVDGEDVNGKHYTFYRMVTFSEDYFKIYQNKNPDSEYIEQTIIFSGLPAGKYEVSEVETIRYAESKWEHIDGCQIKNSPPTYQLDEEHSTAHIKCINSKTNQSSTSHTSLVTNMVTRQRKLTSIAAIWNGSSSITDTKIDRSQLYVYLNYDDGNQERLADDAYELSKETFENDDGGTYTIEVTYDSGNRIYKDSFSVYMNLPKQFTWEVINGESFTDDDGTYYDGEVQITGYTGSQTILNIPKTVSGIRTLTNIGDNQSTGSITFNDNNKTYKVVYVVSKNNEKCLYGVNNITDIIIPETVKSIGNYSFYQCNKLKSITFDNIQNSQLSEIGVWAFGYCNGLTGEFEIPDGVKTIGRCSFCHCSGLTGELKIPDGVETIGGVAFGYCSGLTGELKIPDSVKTIGESAFRRCEGLTGLSFGDNSVLEKIDYGTFSDCYNLTEVKIPDSLKTIGEQAFNSCRGLTGLSFGDNSVLEEIGFLAFNGCNSLTEVKIPDSVKTIGKSAFYYCGRLTGLSFGDNSVLEEIGSYAFRYTRLTGELKIPDSVKTIGEFAFSECGGLTGELKIPDSVTTIGQYAFNSCGGLTSLSFGDNSVLEEIGNFAFRFCGGLTGELKIPDSVKTIGSCAFQWCNSLTSLSFGDNSVLEEIRNEAFRSCGGLTGELKIPDSVKTIGEYAFESCSSLESIRVPNSVTTIGQYAFQDIPIVYYSGTATGTPWGAQEIRPNDE